MKTEGKKDASDNHEDPTKQGVVEITIDMNISHEICIDMVKQIIRKRLRLLKFLMCAIEFWYTPSFLQHIQE